MENAFTYVAKRDRRQPFLTNLLSGFVNLLQTVSGKKEQPSSFANNELAAAAKLASDWIQIGNDLKHSAILTIHSTDSDVSENSSQSKPSFCVQFYSEGRKEKLMMRKKNDKLKEYLKNISPESHVVVIINSDGIITLDVGSKTNLKDIFSDDKQKPVSDQRTPRKK